MSQYSIHSISSDEARRPGPITCYSFECKLNFIEDVYESTTRSSSEKEVTSKKFLQHMIRMCQAHDVLTINYVNNNVTDNMVTKAVIRPR